jgi:rod shape-determining protein MreC
MAGFGWKLARGRGSAAQLPLAICAIAVVIIALLGKAQASIFDHARAKLSDWTAPALAELHGPAEAIQNWFGGLASVFTVYRENLELRKQNAELRKWHDVAISLEQRLHRFESLLNAVPDPQVPSLTARVIGESSRPFVKTLILDAGVGDGVKKGQPVLDDRGVIGRVYVTGERSSWVILLTDLNSRVPVVVAPSNRRAIMAGDNSAVPRLQLDLGGTPVHAGDRVVTTGDGGLLPPGLPVGVVMTDGDGFRVALYADSDRSDYVHVLDYHAPEPPPAAAEAPAATDGTPPAEPKDAEAALPPPPVQDVAAAASGESGR